MVVLERYRHSYELCKAANTYTHGQGIGSRLSSLVYDFFADSVVSSTNKRKGNICARNLHHQNAELTNMNALGDGPTPSSIVLHDKIAVQQST